MANKAIPKAPPNFSTAFAKPKLPAVTKATQDAVITSPLGVDNKLKAGPGMQVPGATLGMPPLTRATAPPAFGMTMPPVPAAPAGPVSSAISGADPISSGLAAIDEQFGGAIGFPKPAPAAPPISRLAPAAAAVQGKPTAPQLPVTPRPGAYDSTSPTRNQPFVPGQPAPAPAPHVNYGPGAPNDQVVSPQLPAGPPISADEAAQQGRNAALGQIDPNDERKWGPINEQQKADALAQVQAEQARRAEMTAGLRNDAQLRGMPEGTSVDQRGQIVAAPRPAAQSVIGSRIVGEYPGSELPIRKPTLWNEDGRTASSVVGGAGHRILRPDNPIATAIADRAQLAQSKKNTETWMGGESGYKNAVGMAKARRQRYLEGTGEFSPDKVEQGKSRAEIVANRQARKDAVAARQMYKGAGRAARLERRKWGPSLQEQMMSQMDPQTAASYMVGMDRNRAMAGSQEADNDLKRAQTQLYGNQAKMSGLMLQAGQDKMNQGGAAAGAVTGAPGATPTAPSPVDNSQPYRDKIGLPNSGNPLEDLYSAFPDGSIPPDKKYDLQQWALNTPDQSEGVLEKLGRWAGAGGAPNPSGYETRKRLVDAVRAGNWPEVEKLMAYYKESKSNPGAMPPS